MIYHYMYLPTIFNNQDWAIWIVLVYTLVILHLVHVLISLFELTYKHKHVWDCFGEVTETTYDISISRFQLISISSKIAYENSL
jgi:hypothetical protein